MFEIISKTPNEITINTKTTKLTFDLVNFEIIADLKVGNIKGPGEFEIGEATIRGIATNTNQVIYSVEINGVYIGIIGDADRDLDNLGVSHILCTSSVRAIREIEPKVVISMGNLDAMVSELKLSAKAEKKYKVKNLDALPSVLEVIALT